MPGVKNCLQRCIDLGSGGGAGLLRLESSGGAGNGTRCYVDEPLMFSSLVPKPMFFSQ